MTRIQRERFPDILEYEKVKDSYVLTAEMLNEAQEHMRVLHPLPRVNEIAYDVDKTKFAGYFPQARNGVIMRQAIILKHLNMMFRPLLLGRVSRLATCLTKKELLPRCGS